MAGLAGFLAGDDRPDAGELMTDPQTLACMRHSATAWGAAHQGTGVTAEAARTAADNTSAAYAPEEKSTSGEGRQ
jgi:hypothetical protein